MKIYWSLKQIPELSELSWRERNIALKKFCSRYILRSRPSWLGLAAYLAVPLLPIAGILIARVLWHHPDSVGLAAALAACAGFFLGMLLSFQISVNQFARFLRDHHSHEQEVLL
jgi:hypothetical protein